MEIHFNKKICKWKMGKLQRLNNFCLIADVKTGLKKSIWIFK